MILQSVITCPHCAMEKPELMPTDACQFFYICTGCGATLRPKAGDCCVFCSYGSVPCPPIQAERLLRPAHGAAMSRGRKLLTGERAFTTVGRQQKQRDLIKENLPPMGSEDRFRRELFWWLHERAPFYPALDVSLVVLAFGQLQTAIVFDVFKFGRKEPYNWQKAYLRRFGWFDKKSGTLQPQGFSLAMLPHIYQSSV